MFKAVAKDGALQAPTVGTWWPHIGRGGPVEDGVALGVIEQAGAIVEVFAPRGSSGVATAVAAAGSWVEHGSQLLTLGAGIEALSAGAVSGQSGEGALPPGVRAICADTDGTVYLHPEPGAPAFVSAGQRVGERGTVALIEVMKTFSQVRSPLAGEVVRVLVEDAESVTEGQQLFWIQQ